MKRAPFIGAAAALLAGCGGHNVFRALPGVGTSAQHRQSTANLRLVPDKAEPIPANVLASPIIGEARRFDGTTAPSGWTFAQGQTLDAAQYPQLGSVLRRKTSGTFAMPNYLFPVIIAVAGTFATSPNAIALGARRTTLTASLGPDAQPVAFRTLSARAKTKQEQREVALQNARQRVNAAPAAPRFSASVPISPERAARIAQSRTEARATALDRISADNRSRAESLVDAIVSGRISTHDAQLQMAAALTADEATTLLAIHDDNERALRPGWAGMQHPDPQNEAANYLVDVTFTPEQVRAYALLPENR